MTLRLVACVLVVALAGCSAGSTAVPRVLLPSAGAGYTVSKASGVLTRGSLERATALPVADMRSYLDSVHLRRAAERVWTARDGSFVTDVVVDVASPAEAAALVDRAEQVLPGPATRAYAVAGVADARGFVQTSAVTGRTMFCVIEFLHVRSSAFVVTRCTPTPQDTTFVTALSAEQHGRAQ